MYTVFTELSRATPDEIRSWLKHSVGNWDTHLYSCTYVNYKGHDATCSKFFVYNLNGTGFVYEGQDFTQDNQE